MAMNTQAPMPPNAKPIAYYVRHWDYSAKRWSTLPEPFTNRARAVKFAKGALSGCKATVLAKLANGKLVFISGTKR